MNIGFYIEYKNWLNNNIFNTKSECNVNDVAERYADLKKYLSKKGINLNTYDYYKNKKNINFWIIVDPKPNIFLFLIKNKINFKKIIIFIQEPYIINPFGWKLIKYFPSLFSAVLIWNNDLCMKYNNFFHYNFPLKRRVDKYEQYKNTSKKKLLLMMHSNKYYHRKGELYSLRRDIIKYYENRGDSLLDLFGKGWNVPTVKNPFFTSLYKGTTEDKWKTYSEYYFSFCIDNSIVPGYITYDPLISMSTGTIPIYIPMPDSTKYIPENTFINYLKFGSLDDLTEYLHSIIKTEEYNRIRKNGWDFINSEKFKPFTNEQFCKNVYKAIKLLNK